MSDKVVKETPKRELVLEMLKEGVHTREQIAQKLGMSVASVSSQFTYLRWMGHYITYDNNKILSLVSKEEYEAWVANRETSSKKTVASKKTIAEQVEALTKLIESQEKQIVTWSAKLSKINDDIKAMPNDLELPEMRDEASANLVLLNIKLKRNKKRLADMPAVEDVTPDDAELDDATDDTDVTETTDDELL